MGNMIEWLRNGGNEMDYNMNNYMQNNNNGEMKEQPVSPLAIASLVLGIIGLITCCCYGGIIGIVGLVLGIMVLVLKMDGRNIAIAGIIVSALSILGTVVIVLMATSYMQQMNLDEMNELNEMIEHILNGNNTKK